MPDEPDVRDDIVNYGPTSDQSFSITARHSAHRPAIVIFFSRDLWKERSGLYPNWLQFRLDHAGYTRAFIMHRPFPKVSLPTILDDMSLAVAKIVEEGRKRGFDEKRLVLAGEGSGAFLAASLATDSRYLQRAGVDPASVRALWAINGEGFDLITESTGDNARPVYLRNRFRGHVESLSDLSPVNHLGAATALRVLLQVEQGNSDALRAARNMEAAATRARMQVTVQMLPRPRTTKIGDFLGAMDNADTREMIAFLQEATATPMR